MSLHPTQTRVMHLIPKPADVGHRTADDLLIHEKIIREVELRQLTRNQIAVHLGEPFRTIRRALSGTKAEIGLCNMERIARALGLRIVLVEEVATKPRRSIEADSKEFRPHTQPRHSIKQETVGA